MRSDLYEGGDAVVAGNCTSVQYGDVGGKDKLSGPITNPIPAASTSATDATTSTATTPAMSDANTLTTNTNNNNINIITTTITNGAYEANESTVGAERLGAEGEEDGGVGLGGGGDCAFEHVNNGLRDGHLTNDIR